MYAWPCVLLNATLKLVCHVWVSPYMAKCATQICNSTPECVMSEGKWSVGLSIKHGVPRPESSNGYIPFLKFGQ